MQHIALMSLKGGTGRTTVAANLGRMLAERSRVVMVDMDPQNALAVALGMNVAEPRGIASPEMGPATLAGYLRTQGAEQSCLPFGRLPAGALHELERDLRGDPHWLDARLEPLGPAGFELSVIDTPSYDSPFLTQALEVASLVIVVLEPCTLSYATLGDTEALLAEVRPRPDFRGVLYVLNRFDGRRTLTRDVRDALRNLEGAERVTNVLPDDEHVREAVANRTTCVAASPHAQFTASLREVVARVRERLK